MDPMIRSPYLAIARPDHWFKNIFVLPGVLVALYFAPELASWKLLVDVPLALAAACLIASSNYVFNEILDAPFDCHHPIKKNRPIPCGQVQLPWAWALWVVLSLVGIGVGFSLNGRVGAIGLLLWVMGLLYNLPPIRAKDLPYVDVLSESVNNPIRLALGWYATGLGAMPPLSLILAYWMFGAFLMACKRFAEYRQISDAQRAGRYRKSFQFYTEERLVVSIYFYATLFALMGGFFIARYKFEWILAAPLVAYAMAYYLHLAYKPNSSAQYTEHLYKEKKLMLIIALILVVTTSLLFMHFTGFSRLFAPWILPPDR